jgi:hypothetical protein
MRRGVETLSDRIYVIANTMSPTLCGGYQLHPPSCVDLLSSRPLTILTNDLTTTLPPGKRTTYDF